MLVVIYTTDGIWIGADSSRSSGGKHVSNVCKIHETRFGILMKSGVSQGVRDTGEVYSTDREVEGLISSSMSQENFKQNVKAAFERDISEELSFLVDNPTVNADNLTSQILNLPIPDNLTPDLLRILLLFRLDLKTLEGDALEVTPHNQEKLIPSSLSPKYKYEAVSDLPWLDISHLWSPRSPSGVSFHNPPSVHEFSYVTSYPRSDDWVREHPQQAMTEILEKGHAEEPQEIGPPFTIVHITRSAGNHTVVKWLSKNLLKKL